MSKYKLSRYNVVFNRDGNDYLWNTFTGALFRLDQEGKDYLSGFDTSDCSHRFFKPLFDAGCIVDERYNELGKILVDEKAVMLNTAPKSIHFTIAPGLGCNYNCVYCFEKDRTSLKVMTAKTRDEVCRYIIQLAEANPFLEYIGITWFGGEPLIYPGIIEEISSVLICYCEKRRIGYGAGIVTNGRLLDGKTAMMLAKNRVSYVQLAMDGMGEYYALQKGTTVRDFEETVDNIVRCADIIPITVRINISDSLDEALKLTDHLLKEKKLDGKIKIYVAHIRDYKEKCMSVEEKSHSNFLELEGEYIRLFGAGGRYSKDSLFYVEPKRRTTTCLSVCANNFCIGPEGELYRCEHHFGNPDYIVGSIEDGRFYSDLEVEYIKHNHPKKCEECNMFPVCLGGCMNDNRGGDVALSCERFKERLIDFIVMKNKTREKDGSTYK